MDPAGRTLDEAAFVLRLDRLLLVVAWGWVFFAFLNLLRGRVISPSIDVIVMVATLGLRWFALRGSLRRMRLVAHLAIALSCLGLLVVSLFSGQADALAIWFVVAAPPFAAYILGAREAAFWALGAAAIVLLNDLSGVLVAIPPEFVPTSVEFTSGRLVLLAMLAAFSFGFRRTTDSQLQALAQREEELLVASRKAEQANRAKTQFLASMSHELRTPLNAILGFAQVLEDEAFGELNERQHKYTRNIHTGGRQLLQQVEDLLEFSRLETGQEELERRPVNPEALLREVAEKFRGRAQDQGLTLELETSAELPELWLDESRFTTLLDKLVDNAIKFTPRGGTVRLKAWPVEGGVRFAVEDTGIGLLPEDQARIFRAFEMVDGTYARRHKGAGLGLALARRLAELHGGRILVESQGADQGSSFQVEVPRQEGAAPGP